MTTLSVLRLLSGVCLFSSFALASIPSSVVNLQGAREGCRGTFLNVSHDGDVLVTALSCLNNFHSGGVALRKDGRVIWSEDVVVHPYLRDRRISDPTRVSGILDLALVKFPPRTAIGMSPIATNFVMSVAGTFQGLLRPLMYLGFRSVPVAATSSDTGAVNVFQPGNPVYNNDGALVAVSRGCEGAKGTDAVGCTAVSLHDQASRELLTAGRRELGSAMAAVRVPESRHEIGILGIFRCRSRGPVCQPVQCAPAPQYYQAPPQAYYAPAPVYVPAPQPQPVVLLARQPVYTPAPAYVPPAPVYVPRPVYMPQPVPGPVPVYTPPPVHIQNTVINHTTTVINHTTVINNVTHVNNSHNEAMAAENQRLQYQLKQLEARMEEERQERLRETARIEQLSKAFDATMASQDAVMQRIQKSGTDQKAVDQNFQQEREKSLELKKQSEGLENENQGLHKEMSYLKKRIGEEESLLKSALANISKETRLLGEQANEGLRRQLQVVASVQEKHRYQIADAHRQKESQREMEMLAILRQPLPSGDELAASTGEFGGLSRLIVPSKSLPYMAAYSRETAPVAPITGMNTLVATAPSRVTQPALASNAAPVAVAAGDSPFVSGASLVASRGVSRDQMAALVENASRATEQLASSGENPPPATALASLPILRVFTQADRVRAHASDRMLSALLE